MMLFLVIAISIFPILGVTLTAAARDYDTRLKRAAAKVAQGVPIEQALQEQKIQPTSQAQQQLQTLRAKTTTAISYGLKKPKEGRGGSTRQRSISDIATKKAYEEKKKQERISEIEKYYEKSLRQIAAKTGYEVKKSDKGLVVSRTITKQKIMQKQAIPTKTYATTIKTPTGQQSQVPTEIKRKKQEELEKLGIGKEPYKPELVYKESRYVMPEYLKEGNVAQKELGKMVAILQKESQKQQRVFYSKDVTKPQKLKSGYLLFVSKVGESIIGSAREPGKTAIEAAPYIAAGLIGGGLGVATYIAGKSTVQTAMGKESEVSQIVTGFKEQPIQMAGRLTGDIALFSATGIVAGKGVRRAGAMKIEMPKISTAKEKVIVKRQIEAQIKKPETTIKETYLTEPKSIIKTRQKEAIRRAGEQLKSEVLSGQQKIVRELPSKMRRAARKDIVGKRSISPLDTSPKGVFAKELPLYEPKSIIKTRQKEAIRRAGEQLKSEVLSGQQKIVRELPSKMRRTYRKQLIREKNWWVQQRLRMGAKVPTETSGYILLRMFKIKKQTPIKQSGSYIYYMLKQKRITAIQKPLLSRGKSYPVDIIGRQKAYKVAMAKRIAADIFGDVMVIKKARPKASEIFKAKPIIKEKPPEGTVITGEKQVQIQLLRTKQETKTKQLQAKKQILKTRQLQIAKTKQKQVQATKQMQKTKQLQATAQATAQLQATAQATAQLQATAQATAQLQATAQSITTTQAKTELIKQIKKITRKTPQKIDLINKEITDLIPREKNKIIFKGLIESHKPSYDVLIKRKLQKIGKKYKSKGYKIAERGLTKEAALGRLAEILDKYANRSGKIKKSTKAAKIRYDLENKWKALQYKFRKAKRDRNILVEKVKYAIDSNMEKNQIPYEGIRARKAMGIIKKARYGKWI